MKHTHRRLCAWLLAAALAAGLAGCAPGSAQKDGPQDAAGAEAVQTLFNGGAAINDSSAEAKLLEGKVVEVPTLYYQQFGADPKLGDDAAKTYGGWQKSNVKLNLEKTAIVIMHAAYVGEAEQAPEQFQYCEYVPRSYRLAKENFPAILEAARAAGVKVYHVPFGAGYYEDLPGYIETQALGAEPSYAPRDTAEADEVLKELYSFKDDHVTPGPGAWDGIIEARKKYADFLPEAKPVGNEPIAVTANELAAVAKRDGINHLIYMGFAVDACLLLSEGGMQSMQARGFLCSAVKDCVTAVENRESTPSKHHTDTALWRIATSFGFVYESKDLCSAFELITQS